MTDELYLYVIMRNDIKIPAGKAMAQAGHGFLCALEKARTSSPDLVAKYLSGPIAKVVLQCGIDDLEKANHALIEANITSVIITDEARTVFKEPTVTCLGFGPVSKSMVPGIIAKMRLA